jgi:uracil phosphoribosyltransferase
VDTDRENSRLAVRISVLLVSEAMRDLPTTPAQVSTPMGLANGRRIGVDVVVVPVLRAGLGMLDAVLELWPAARVGHIGLQRDEETAIASQYYAKLPAGLHDSYVLVIDPMLATGGSAVAALALLARCGAGTPILCTSPRRKASPVEREFPTVRTIHRWSTRPNDQLTRPARRLATDLRHTQRRAPPRARRHGEGEPGNQPNAKAPAGPCGERAATADSLANGDHEDRAEQDPGEAACRRLMGRLSFGEALTVAPG